jgi:hypothetical protein
MRTDGYNDSQKQSTNKQTKPVEHSPPLQAISFLASREFPRILWNTKVHNFVHMTAPLFCILS